MIKLKKFVIVILSEENSCVKKDADKEEKDVIKDVDEKEVVKKNLNEKKVVIKEKVVIEDVAENKIKKKDVNEKNAVVSEAVMKIKEF